MAMTGTRDGHGGDGVPEIERQMTVKSRAGPSQGGPCDAGTSAAETSAAATSVAAASAAGAGADADARYERLLREHGAALRRVAALYEHDPAAREDLFQDVCVAIWRALDRFRGESSERTFIFRIAHNRGLTHRLRRRPADVALDVIAEPAAPVREADPEHVVQARRRQAALQAAVARLPLAMRQVMVLTLEGLSQREIADVLGITENNVAVRVTRARRLLRADLAPAENAR